MVVSQRRYWIILTSLTAVAFIYSSLINTTIQDTNESKPFTKEVKKIVAYSLLKQIERDSEFYACDEQLNTSEINDIVISSNVEVDDVDKVIESSDEDTVWTNVDGSDMYVLSAHLDRRLAPYHYVRIIGMIRGNQHQTFYCQISSNTKLLHAAKVTITPIWLDIWNQNDTNIYFNPVLISCRIPFGLTPKAVYLVTKPCYKEPKKDLFVTTTVEKKQYKFTVCVKPLDFLEDISKRLIQWIEISRILGAERIVIYVKRVKREVLRILKWYSSTYPEQIIIRTFKFIREKETGHRNKNFSKILWQKRRYEVIAYNNCFYRNFGNSQFIIPLDIDEVIIPKHQYNWKNMLEDIFTSFPEVKDNYAAYMVPNTYFFGKLSTKTKNQTFFLENLHRSHVSPPGESGKSFISTNNTLTVFNHYTLEVLKPGVSRAYFLPFSVVQLNHYKESCNAVILPECVKHFSSPRIKDSTALRYKEIFMDEYLKKMSLLRQMGVIF